MDGCALSCYNHMLVKLHTHTQHTPTHTHTKGVTRAVYRGVLDLLKLLLQCVEEDYQREPEGPLFSVFLILRISFTIYYEPKQKSTLGFSLRSALSVGSSFLGHTDSYKSPRETTTSSWSESSSQTKTESMTSVRASRTQPRAGSVDSSLLSSRNGLMSSGNFELSDNTTPTSSNTLPTINRSSTSFSTPTRNISSVLSPKTSSPQRSHEKASGGTQASFKRSPSPSRSLDSTIKHSHLSSIMVQDDLMTQLVNSPRFFHPIDGQDLKSCNFLYKELLRGQGAVKPFLLKKDFWNTVFMSTIDTDRGYLGWNERTADLYRR